MIDQPAKCNSILLQQFSSVLLIRELVAAASKRDSVTQTAPISQHVEAGLIGTSGQAAHEDRMTNAQLPSKGAGVSGVEICSNTAKISYTCVCVHECGLQPASSLLQVRLRTSVFQAGFHVD